MKSHWLMQGDCLKRMKEIPDGSVDMVLCDLPFAVTRNKWDVAIPFEPLWEQYHRVCKPEKYPSKNYGTQKSRVVTVTDEYCASTLLTQFPKQVFTGGHPTQKPVSLLEYLIRTYTNEGETVLDNCMGSGPTGVACMNTSRRFIGIELDEDYFKMATERINGAKLPLED